MLAARSFVHQCIISSAVRGLCGTRLARKAENVGTPTAAKTLDKKQLDERIECTTGAPWDASASPTEEIDREDLGLDDKDVSFDDMMKGLLGTVKHRVLERPPAPKVLDPEVRDQGRVEQDYFREMHLVYHRERIAGKGHEETVAKIASRAGVSEKILSLGLLHTSLAIEVVEKEVSEEEVVKQAVWATYK
mmetsp:Transcript_29633/g.49801  ORF Transcript_29633/g.49801 Transcript_29633/m.49801 type:complete len:191 (+) Transcript_29633:82-654(+)|eukprot:CAMPEP_0198201490 /NCGR_PEP_ID=MMETSP1445-20131203/4367_1 /TAXON_ID=36898 /ORGANISM="Pyramimonas sp., Strain CCMP2087" /LENGTH=190 /DNA_ID=CAMNT_0043871881 /DNA_START=103 /DNA_END=675 /DNA_ORIENTATION=-